MPGTDVPAALDAAWRVVMPQFDLAAGAPFLERWSHPLLGEAVLTLEDGRLIAHAGEVRSELLAAQDEATGESFQVTAPPPLVGFRIALRDDGGERSLVVFDPGSVEVYAFTQIGQ